MPLLDKLEQKIGRFAIPRLINVIAIFQLVALGSLVFLQGDARGAFEQFLMLKPDNILHGEVWRLFTYTLIPYSTLIWSVFGSLFLMWMGRGLEEAWGAFRVNLYVFGGMIAFGGGALLFGYESGQILFFLSILLAFACIYPNEEMRLYFFIPLKIKWFAALSLGFTIVTIFRAPVYAIPTFFALLNFFIAFGPDFLKGRLAASKIAQRRERFASAALDPDSSFHRCSICGKTEIDDRTLDFRVTDDGEEICSECRKARVTT